MRRHAIQIKRDFRLPERLYFGVSIILRQKLVVLEKNLQGGVACERRPVLEWEPSGRFALEYISAIRNLDFKKQESYEELGSCARSSAMISPAACRARSSFSRGKEIAPTRACPPPP